MIKIHSWPSNIIESTQNCGKQTCIYVQDLARRIQKTVLVTLMYLYEYIAYYISHIKEKAHHKVASNLFEASKKYTEAELQRLHEAEVAELHKLQESNILATHVTIPSGNAMLDGIEFNNANAKNNRWMIVFLPNKAVWQEVVDPLRQFAVETRSNLLCCNYRPTGLKRSVAKSERDIIQDGKNLVEYVHNKGIDYQNIHLHGYSLGGAVATLVLGAMRREGKELYKLSNERSFSSIHDVLVSRSFVSGHFYSVVLSLFGWRLNTKTELAQLNRSKLREVRLIVLDLEVDDKIPKKARFLTALQQYYKKELVFDADVINMEPNGKQMHAVVKGHCTHDNPHARLWSPGEMRRFTEYVDKDE